MMGSRQHALMHIGEVASKSGISARMIRHYEQTGLLPPAARTEAGYRLYSLQDMQQLQFIHRSRQLGFSGSQIQQLLELWRDEHRASAQVKQLVITHLTEVEHKIAELQQMQQVLSRLAAQCVGDHQPDCAILQQIADK